MQHTTLLLVAGVMLMSLALGVDGYKKFGTRPEDCVEDHDQPGKTGHFKLRRDDKHQKMRGDKDGKYYDKDGKYYDKDGKYYDKDGKHPDDDKKDRESHTRIIIIGICCLGVAAIIVGVAAGLYKNHMVSRRAVGPPTPVKMIDIAGHVGDPEKNGSLPPVGLPYPPAYVIAGVPPPVYSLCHQPMDESRAPSAPPTYSSLDLHRDASDVTVVNVRPMVEK